MYKTSVLLNNGPGGAENALDGPLANPRLFDRRSSHDAIVRRRDDGSVRGLLRPGGRRSARRYPRADPVFALAHMDNNGEVCIQTLRRVPKAEIHTEKRTKDGGIVEVPVEVTLMVPQFNEEKVNLKDLRAFDADGTSIDPQTLPERLKKETVVLLSTDGAKVDPRFLAAVKEGTLVLVPPVTRTDANPGPKNPVEKR